MKTIPYCLALLTLAGVPSHAALPDLVVKSVIVKATSVAQGGSVRVMSTVKNTGSARAGKSRVCFYLSNNAVKDAGDIRLTSYRVVSALRHGKSSTATTNLKIPASCKPGTYYVIASADALKQVRESSEKNNTRTASTRTRVTDKVPPVPEDFVLIPAGSFQMGDQSNPLVGASDELPVHSVYVSAFYMGKYETTKELWDAVLTWGLANGYTDLPTGEGKAANHPVHSITWYEMVKWCNARSEKENLTPCYTVSGATFKAGQSDAVVCNWSANGYRLPTEAEWEKAARGGLSGKNFPWGTDTITHFEANYESSSDYAYDVSPTRGFHPTYYTDGSDPYTSPVGSFAPNGYGLYDMAGNMWEWCWDWHSYSYYASSPGTDPRGAASGEGRVYRGGGWWGNARESRVASRDPSIPSFRLFGFRLARSSDR